MTGFYMFAKIFRILRYKYSSLGFLIIFTILIRLPILVEPWGADQAGFGHVARGVLEGKVPYKDLYSLAGYGIIFTYTLFFKLFGINMMSVHIGHMLLSVITLCLVFFLTQHLYGKRPALIAGLCYTIFSNGLGFSGFGYDNNSAWGTYWYLSQREVFMAPLFTGAVYLTALNNKKNVILIQFIIGALIGLAATYKFTAVLMLILFIATIVYEGWVKGAFFDFKGVSKKISALILGSTLIHIPFLYYLWKNDALNDMYQELIVHISTYARLSRGLRIETFFSGHFSILSENFVLWLFALISGIYILFKDRSKNNVYIVLWAIASLLMVWGQGKFFGYHFLILVPPFAVLTGYGLTIFFENGNGLKGFLLNNLKDIRKTFMLVTTIMCLLGFGISNYDYYRIHIIYFLGKISKKDYYQVFNEFPTHPYSFRSDYQLVEYLKEHSKPEDKLGVIFSAGDTVIHFLSGIEPATRFTQSWYLFPSDETLALNEITVRLRHEFIRTLIDKAPRFILCVHIPLDDLIRQRYLKDDIDIRQFHALLRTGYKMTRFPDNRFLFEKL